MTYGFSTQVWIKHEQMSQRVNYYDGCGMINLNGNAFDNETKLKNSRAEGTIAAKRHSHGVEQVNEEFKRWNVSVSVW